MVVTSNVDIRNEYTGNSTIWSVGYSDIEGPIIEGNAEELSPPTVVSKSTILKDFRVAFHSKNDSISYTFKLGNHGVLDSRVSSIEYSNPYCIGSGDNEYEDTQMVCRGITMKLTYENGKEIEVGDILRQGLTEKVKLTITYNGDGMPKNPVTVENLSATVIYVQD